MIAARILRPLLNGARQAPKQLPQPRATVSFSQFHGRAQSRMGYPRHGPQYSRFNRANNLKALWYQSPTFRYGVGAVGLATGTVYVYNLEQVPVSGRRRFNIVSKETEEQMAKQLYQQTLQQFGNKVLPARDPRSRMVQRVLNRLIPASGLGDANWEIHVVDDKDTINAFVIPGGKVFVFSGILDICQGEDGLAAVLGHEIAHNVAHHAAERMSQLIWVIVGMYGMAFVLGTPDFLSQLLLDYGLMKPGSRKQESEADYIGLMMMAQSCFDPEAAVGLWQRMEKAEKYAPPQFMSTHPSSHNRIGKIQQWLPEAQDKRAQSDCGGTLGYADDFRRQFDQVIW
ncbi:MAG: hypothetical protein M1827_002566 [Pycnora praestabilis]|nr:MAG: hypothetical protein M1827_002566 [Pycnora praestabilis]